MATALSLPPVSVDEYFDGGLWEEFEYDNGVLVPRNIGSRAHSRMISRIDQLLGGFKHVTAYAGLVLSIPHKGKYRVPDVCCYAAGTDPGETLEQQPPPVAIFEVVSKTDTISEMQKKCAEYLQIGVRHVFIIDPQQAVVLVPEGKGFPPLEGDMVFHVGDQSVSIAIRDLFAG